MPIKQFSYWMTLFLMVCPMYPLAVWATDSMDNRWPREIPVSEGVVVIYQPQPEKLEDNRLDARAAVAVELKDAKEPVFGAVWFQARLETDRAERTATIADIFVVRVRFPEEDEQKAQQLTNLLEKETPGWQLPISLDQLLTTLDMGEKRVEAANINTDPPRIVFVPEPAVLITIDGEPRLTKEDGSEVMRVINTPFTLLLEPSAKKYYLFAQTDTWYSADDIEGDWGIAENVPEKIAQQAPKTEENSQDQEDVDEEEKAGPPPKIIVSTEPAELISSEGKPEYTPISGTDLLYMSNTDSDVLLHITEQIYYVLLAGRWYTSADLEGPWNYMPGDKLPIDFAKIPEDAEMGTVLYAVPETDVAKEAVLDTQVPQTAAVDRKKASLTVEYDGDPAFEKIKGTNMTYAVNTQTPVIHVDKKYYACDEAVWFVADSPTGPWQVATAVADEIYDIPPESSLYHVTFVRIYMVTEELVYVGYTQGYTHTYVYQNTIVYGTGYWYPGWYGRYYYPRPCTWGFHVRYNPWTGWRFGFSYSNGPFTFYIGGGGWYRGGWWGPGRYRGYRRGYRHGYRRGRNAGYQAGYRAGRRNAAQQNLYRSQRNQGRTKVMPSAAGKQSMAGASVKRANNVYTDSQGNVHRKTDQGWQERTKDGWKSQEKRPTETQQQKPQSAQTQQKKPRQQQSQQLERSSQARKQGSQRARTYSNARGGSGRGRGGPGGGGGRR
jgi:hypothetical protein